MEPAVFTASGNGCRRVESRDALYLSLALFQKPNPLENLRGLGTEIKEKGFGPDRGLRVDLPLLYFSSPRLRRDSSWTGRSKEEGRDKTPQQWRPTPWGLNGMLGSQDARVALQKDVCASVMAQVPERSPWHHEGGATECQGALHFPKDPAFPPKHLRLAYYLDFQLTFRGRGLC